MDLGKDEKWKSLMVVEYKFSKFPFANDPDYNFEFGSKRVLWVAENGSKAWGYDSPKSDKDPKFVYVQRETDYLSLFGYQDHVKMIDEAGDEWVGWDVRKVLSMTLAGNAQAYELFASNIVYFRTYMGEKLAAFCLEYLQNKQKQMAFHYYGLAKKTYREKVENVGEQITTKKYLYIVRPLLSSMELMEGKFPELDFGKLLEQNRFSFNKREYMTVQKLLEDKRAGLLSSDVKSDRLADLDKWIEFKLEVQKSKLDNWVETEKSEKELLTNQEKFDIMFLELLNSV